MGMHMHMYTQSHTQTHTYPVYFETLEQPKGMSMLEIMSQEHRMVMVSTSGGTRPWFVVNRFRLSWKEIQANKTTLKDTIMLGDMDIKASPGEFHFSPSHHPLEPLVLLVSPS